MKIKFKYTVVILFLSVFLYSCNDDTQDLPKDNPNNPSKSEGDVEVKVFLPEVSDVDLSGALVCSLGSNGGLSGDLKGYVPFNEGSIELGYLVNEQDELLLAGFLTDDRKEISVATTAEVMLYFGMGSSLNTLEYKRFFINNIGKEQAYTDLVGEFETAFVNNPKVFSVGGYTEALNNAIIALTEKETVDVYTKSLDLGSTIESSGLSLNEEGKHSFTVTNNYPRRTHGFLYFKSYKDYAGNETTIKSEISGNDVADRELEIPFISLADENKDNFQVQGTNYSLCSRGTGYKAKVSDVFKLDLPEDHLSETYELAIVGPGLENEVERDFTEEEQKKFEQLSIETFVLDYFIPVLVDIGGNRDLYSAQVLQKASGITAIVEPILRAHKPSIDAVLDNDFELATKQFLPFLYDDIRLSNDLRTIMTGLYGMISDGSSPNTFIQNNELIEEGEARYLKVTSALLSSLNESVGIDCLNERLSSSNPLEKWDIKVTDGLVKIKPEKIVVLPFGDNKDIYAQVYTDLSDGETIEYEWHTTSTYSSGLNDYNGQDGTSFTTSNNKVAFYSTATSSQLGNSENLEQVTVKAYLKSGSSRTEIGSASMVADVKKKKFIIRPDGITIEGDERVRLQLKHTDGSTVIPNGNTDYKIVWTTPAKYGLFYGLTSSQTLYNSPNISYYADDTDVEEGYEVVKAFIYAKSKNSNKSYKLIDEADATIHIKNDPNCDIYRYDLEADFQYKENDLPCGTSYHGEIITTVPKDEEATSYMIEWTEVYTPQYDTYYNLSGVSWTNESQPSNVEDNGDSFTVYSGLANGAACSDAGGVPKAKAFIEGITGYASLTICY